MKRRNVEDNKTTWIVGVLVLTCIVGALFNFDDNIHYFFGFYPMAISKIVDAKVWNLLGLTMLGGLLLSSMVLVPTILLPSRTQ